MNNITASAAPTSRFASVVSDASQDATTAAAAGATAATSSIGPFSPIGPFTMSKVVALTAVVAAQATGAPILAPQSSTERAIASRMFRNLFTKGALSVVLILCHRIADGTLQRFCSDPNFSTWSLHAQIESVTGNEKCDQPDISQVSFDEEKDELNGFSCLWHWSRPSLFMDESHIQAMFQLLKRSGGVTLAAALAIPEGQCFNVYGNVASRTCQHYIDCVLAEPLLDSGWNITGYSTWGHPHRISPLLQYLVSLKASDATCAKIVERTDDETINLSDDPDQRNPLFCAVHYGFLETLRALALRPSLDMNPKLSIYANCYCKSAIPTSPLESPLLETPSSVSTSPSPDIETSVPTRETTIHGHPVHQVFAEMQRVYDILPTLINDAIFDCYGVTLGQPVCCIVAQYYRMPYPIFSVSQTVSSTMLATPVAAAAASETE